MRYEGTLTSHLVIAADFWQGGWLFTKHNIINSFEGEINNARTDLGSR
jgi:hypothetical protein